jgi:hypothetical protein
MKTGNAKWIGLVVSAWLLAGCQTLAEYPHQPSITTGGSVERSTIHIHVVRDFAELQRKCLNSDPNYVVYACAYPSVDYVTPKKSLCTIFTALPDNRDDTARIAILGHETWHCFGATHIDARFAAAAYR